jgi:hypothetical protein
MSLSLESVITWKFPVTAVHYMMRPQMLTQTRGWYNYWQMFQHQLIQDQICLTMDLIKVWPWFLPLSKHFTCIHDCFRLKLWEKIVWGMQHWTVFINKIRMLQQTQGNTIGRRSMRVRMNVSGLPALIRAPVIIFIVCKGQLSV